MGNFAEIGARNGDMYDDISQKWRKKKQYNGYWSSWKQWAVDNLFNYMVNLYKEVNLIVLLHLLDSEWFNGFPSKVTI